jgi:hypothetical protein
MRNHLQQLTEVRPLMQKLLLSSRFHIQTTFDQSQDLVEVRPLMQKLLLSSRFHIQTTFDQSQDLVEEQLQVGDV